MSRRDDGLRSGRPAAATGAVAPDPGPETAIGERVLERYRERSPGSRRRFEEAERIFPGGVTRSITFYPPYPVTLVRGEGCTVHDADGIAYLDLLNNFTALVHGHDPEPVRRALAETVASRPVHHAPIELQTRLGAMIRERVASVERIRFTNSGTEAVMTALRLARAFTGRPKVLKMEGAFHGGADAIAMSVHPGAGAPAFPAAVPESPGMPPGIEASVLVAPYNDADTASELIARFARELAAVIVEPMTWSSGAIPAEPAFLEALREETRRHGIVLVFDEVVTFRLAYGGAQELYGIAPDLTAFGKAVGGGLPIGALGGREDVMALLDPRRSGFVPQSGTFSGSALSMAAGIAALESLDRTALRSLNERGDRARRAVAACLAEVGIPARVTGRGSLGYVHFGAEPVRDYRSALRARTEARPWLHLALLNRGVMLDPRGHFALSTPMTDDHVDRFVAALADAASELRPLLTARAPEGRGLGAETAADPSSPGTTGGMA